MFKKFLLSKKTLILNDGEEMNIFYYMISDISANGGINPKPFGICVSIRENSGEEEEAIFANLYEKPDEAKAVLNLLIKYGVTPISACDVLEDASGRAS